MTRLENEKQYEWAVKRVEELLPVTKDSPDDPNMFELTLLSNLVADYEELHYPVNAPSLQEILKLRMYEMGLTQKGLADIVGVSASRMSQYLSGQAEPTIHVARNICNELNVPANIVLGVAR